MPNSTASMPSLSARKFTWSISTWVQVGDFIMTVSVRMADRSTRAMASGSSMPVWRNCSVTIVAVDPMGRFKNKMGLAVVTSAMRW